LAIFKVKVSFASLQRWVRSGFYSRAVSDPANTVLKITSRGFPEASNPPPLRIFSNRRRGFYFITGFPTRLIQYGKHPRRLIKKTGTCYYWRI
jgi:hypothetical protein